MSVTSYRKGYVFERMVRQWFESEGYLVIRSAGSHGLFDLVALKDGEKPLLIQCKVNPRISDAEKQTLRETARKAGGVAMLVYRDKDAIVREIL